MPRKAEFIFPPKRCEWPILSSLIIYEAFFEVPYIVSNCSAERFRLDERFERWSISTPITSFDSL